MPFFDGHMHSTFSDGYLEPEALVDAVQKTGTSAMALTDHDTFNGHPRAQARCKEVGVRFVPGVEMSVDLLGREIHVLAYFVGPENTELATALEESRQTRRAHLAGALEKLSSIGFPLTEAEVLAEAGDESVGRPHIAKAMLKRGYVTSVDDAFKRYLGDGRPGHLPRKHIASADMIALVNKAGGVCSSAHPGIYGLDAPRLETLRDYGLKGIEVYHPEHNPSDVVFYLRQCERLGLVPTGGSDFHGAPDKPHVRLGSHGLSEGAFTMLEAKRG